MVKKSILNIVVAGIKNETNSKWLLIQRNKGDYQKKWALVGGKMEFGETIKEAIAREIKEETSLDILWRGIRAVINERLIEKETNQQIKQFMIFLCQTTTNNEKIKVTEEGQLRWFSQKEIEEIKDSIIPSDYFMLTELLFTKDKQKCIVEIDMIQHNQDLEIRKKVEY
ncbi:MAG: NUDIX hydrolase [Candidatus Heimdallarchaeaceae archaeon]